MKLLHSSIAVAFLATSAIHAQTSMGMKPMPAAQPIIVEPEQADTSLLVVGDGLRLLRK